MPSRRRLQHVLQGVRDTLAVSHWPQSTSSVALFVIELLEPANKMLVSA